MYIFSYSHNSAKSIVVLIYFQNHNARIIFYKICLKVKKKTKDFLVNGSQIKFKEGFSYIFFEVRSIY